MKNYVTLNNTLQVFYPDGFHVMDEAERSKLKSLGGGPVECLSDPERHILISTGWKSLGMLTGMLFGAKDAAESAEAQVRKAMKGNGYRSNGFFTKEVGGEEARGYCYEYEAEGMVMYGETCVVKRGKELYFLHFYTRVAMKDENLEMWNGMLASAAWN